MVCLPAYPTELGHGRTAWVKPESGPRARGSRMMGRDMNTANDILRRTRTQNAEFVIESIKELGLQPHPQSRLMQMYRVLTGEEGIIQPDHAEFEVALEAERDFNVLGFVFDQARAHALDSGFIRLVKDVLKDSLFPNEDRTQSKGRDAQFELFVAAICQAANLTPVVREEPDVTCHIDGIKFGIAAKRIKSTSSLEKRVRKGAKQINAAGLPGVVALEMTEALNPDNDRITTPISDNQIGRLYSQALREYMGGDLGRLQEWVGDKGVCGVVIHYQQVRRLPNGEWSLDGMTLRVKTARRSRRLNREYAMFDTHYWKGLPNVEMVPRATPSRAKPG